MSPKKLPPLRRPPSAEALAAQQRAAEAEVLERIEKISSWAEEPVLPVAQPEPVAPPAVHQPEPPAVVPAPTKRVRQAAQPPAAPAPVVQQIQATVTTAPPPAPVAAPEAPKKPWQVAGDHPYHLVMSEALFQKMDFAWKRKGYASLRKYLLENLQKLADADLVELGEQP